MNLETIRLALNFKVHFYLFEKVYSSKSETFIHLNIITIFKVHKVVKKCDRKKRN